MTDLHPAVAHLRAVSRDYPGCWKAYDQFRQDRREMGDWPEWCYCPMAAAYAIVSGGGSNRLGIGSILEVARLSALAAWRPTQGIYRFDPDLYVSLCKAPVKGEIPCDLLYRLPAWCVYVETPGAFFDGFFSHLEYDMNHHRHELRLLLVGDHGGSLGFAPIPLHLGQWTIKEAFEKTVAHGLENQMRGYDAWIPAAPDWKDGHAEGLLGPLVSLLLYLCSEAPDYQRPLRPEPKRIKDKHGGKTWKLFPAKRAETIEVGARIGAALRRVQSESPGEPQGGTHASPRPHIRAAHWHLYWTGPKTGEQPQQPRVRWIPPTGVNLDLGDIDPTIRPVRP